MMDVKKQSMKSLANKMMIESKEKFIEECKKEINQMELLMSTEMDKEIRENEYLHKLVQESKDKIIEI